MKASVYDTQKIEDAERRRDAAKERLEHQDMLVASGNHKPLWNWQSKPYWNFLT